MSKYIGNFKLTAGSIKIIPGEIDTNIIEKRNIILSHLDEVLKGGKKLQEKNFEKYFLALDGKYIRNNICVSGSSSKCKNAKNISIGGAHNLLKLASKKKFNMKDILTKFKRSAPKLYEEINNKVSKKINKKITKISSNKSDKKGGINLYSEYPEYPKYPDYNYPMYGGKSKLREEIENININNLRELILEINI